MSGGGGGGGDLISIADGHFFSFTLNSFLPFLSSYLILAAITFVSSRVFSL